MTVNIQKNLPETSEEVKVHNWEKALRSPLPNKKERAYQHIKSCEPTLHSLVLKIKYVTLKTDMLIYFQKVFDSAPFQKLCDATL